MGTIENRLSNAIAWLSQHQEDDDGGHSGWGWVPDVPANPQNTAEVVCAFDALGLTVPRPDDVLRLVRKDAVPHASRGRWAFESLIDVAWRLRAMRCLTPDPTNDPYIQVCVEALLPAQDKLSGGWRLGEVGPVSVTATSASVLALLGVSEEGTISSAVERGIRMLITAGLVGDERATTIHGAAQIVDVLNHPQVIHLRGVRGDRASKNSLDAVMAYLAETEYTTEQEAFRRGGNTDTWRHLTLHLAIRAVARAAPDRLFDPSFRRGLIHLLDLQDRDPDSVHCGGFRTSPEGFVTSYATTQAIEALVLLNSAVTERANPASTFDMICRLEGEHHTDPQSILVLGANRTSLTINSSAGLAWGVSALGSGVPLLVLSIVFANELGRAGSRALVVWALTVLGVGTYAAVSTRLPRASKRSIAAGVFAGYTAAILPIVAYLLP